MCLTLAASVSCKGDEPKAKEPDLELKRRNEQKGVRKTPTRNTTRRRATGAPTAKQWTTEQRAEFCRTAFGETDVHSLLGFRADTQGQVQTQMPASPPRTARCQYTLPGPPKRPPQYEALMMIDCRRGMLHNQQMTRRGFGKQPEKMESINIGAGGTYAHFKIAMGSYKAPIHQINFIHQSPRCTVTVRTRYVNANRVTQLARYVDRRVNTQNAPY